MRKPGTIYSAVLILPFVFLVSSCAGLKGPKFATGPEFDQRIQLIVSDDYENFQAVRSGYDAGDLQAFHSQHTFPILVKDAFEELFAGVEMIKNEAGIEASAPQVPAIFEVHMIDMAHDVYTEADSYRAEATIAVAMKSPRGEIFWQKAFRGEGYVIVDPQFSTGLGPQDAVIEAVGDALSQMQDSIVSSSEVKNQLKYYGSVEEARRKTEIKI